MSETTIKNHECIYLITSKITINTMDGV